jgi:hypothetical protein
MASTRLGRWLVVLPVGLALQLGTPAAARAADFEVRSPIIDPGEFEFDAKFARGIDRRSGQDRGYSLVGEFEYGATDWWSPAVEGEWVRPAGPDAPTTFDGISFENRFQLADHGRHWADPGLFVEYERGRAPASPDALRVGPLLRKDFGRTINVLDLLVVQEFGPRARSHPAAAYSWQTRWRLNQAFQPGFELFGGALDVGRGAERQHMAGPAAFGVFPFGNGHDVRYELGYLFGLGPATPDATIKLLIGYEYQF